VLSRNEAFLIRVSKPQEHFKKNLLANPNPFLVQIVIEEFSMV